MSRLLPLLVVLLGGSPAIAQDEQKTPRVEVTQSVGPPGGKVAVPVRLVGADPAQIGSVTLVLSFPASSLTFEKLEIGGLGEAVGATGTSSWERRGANVALQVTIETPDRDGNREPLPDGPVAQILFTVARDLEPETVIRMTVEATARPLGAGETIPIAAKPAEIVVSNPTVISCFFYMH